MTAINTALGNVTLGNPQVFDNLEVTPLLSPEFGEADYLTLDEAQAAGLAIITEVSEAGSVPTLLLENAADVALFLLDGEELVGAKQNRILNLTLLVPAKTRKEIPVSCVEKGRWSHRTREFTTTERAFFSKGRARKAARVSENLREGGDRASNQGEVWSDISDKMRGLSVDSATDAISDAYEHFSEGVDAFVEGFRTVPHQVGACFAINGEIKGLELFETSDTCHKLMPKLIRSYALDALEEKDTHPGPNYSVPSVREFLRRVAGAPADAFDALGEGKDLRIHSNGIAGGALVVGERVVHLCAFNQT